MDKSKGFFSILIPGTTVFISSACIMVLELVASRLIAKHLGSSLYTWTAVIGIVLAGITVGNYLGGRIADKFKARKTLASIFVLSSIACVMVVVLNNFVGDWIWLWKLSWPVRVFSHVALVFLGPSVLLGTISPVVAKMALDRGMSTGRTVGDIYACGAAGSIFGTFLAGFYLIPAIGTIAIVWSVGAVLLIMGIIYWVRLWQAYIWLIVFVCALVMGMSPAEAMKKTGASIGLRQKSDPAVIYESETPYCYVAVRQLSEKPDKRQFIQDKLKHSEIIMEDVNDLQYKYEQIHAAVTHRLSKKKNKLSTLIIGGGGYVFPRYIESIWPGSRVDVAEIDPGVTKAATAAFGLPQKTTINTYSMDARNYVDELLIKKNRGELIPQYDFIYEDALNDYSVPFQLVTTEFNQKLAILLGDEGIYMVELIDVFETGLFLSALVNTVEKTFPYVYVITEAEFPKSIRNTFVVVAAKKPLDLKNLEKEYEKRALDLWLLNDSDIKLLKQKTSGIILTDDYAPVENLLAPVVRKSSKEALANKYRNEAKKLIREDKFSEAVAKYEKMLKTDPSTSIEAYNEIAILSVKQGKLIKAIECLKKALTYNETADVNSNMGNIHFNLAVAQQRLNQSKEALMNFENAISEYKKQLIKTPDSIKTLCRLGDAFASIGNFNEATPYFQKVVNLDPTIVENQFKFIQVLEYAGKLDEAIEATGNAQKFFLLKGQRQIAENFKEYLSIIKSKKEKKGDRE